eukprot:Skav206090  [mRNA]  locus=scaffold2150:171468:181946:- [translate_table: standard]
MPSMPATPEPGPAIPCSQADNVVSIDSSMVACSPGAESSISSLSGLPKALVEEPEARPVLHKPAAKEDKLQVSEKEGWWTAEVIAEWKGIKVGCKDYEKKVEASVQGLHRDQALAQLGVKEYEYTHQDTERLVSRNRQLELKEEVEDVDENTFQAARAAMHKGPGNKMITNKASSSQPNKGGLHKAQEEGALAGKSSSSKRKRDDSSSNSEDWQTFSLNLHAKNLLPGTVAKRAVEKAKKAGAVGPAVLTEIGTEIGHWRLGSQEKEQKKEKKKKKEKEKKEKSSEKI